MSTSLIPAVEPVRLSWELFSPAPLAEVWEVLSDTDHFNEVAGTKFRYEDTPQADGTSRRVGRTLRFGFVPLVWDELPWQYRAPEWFKVVRRYQGGPASEVHVLLRLRAVEHGTAVRYTVEVYPRNVLARLLVELELRFFTRPQLDRALRIVLAPLTGQIVDSGPQVPPLSKEGEARLATISARLSPPTFAQHLADYLREAPLREQDRMAPLRLGKAWGLPEPIAIAGFLGAVREGALTLHWDVICPSCLGAKQRPQRLGDTARKVHCTSCNVYFDATFPDSVAVSFRPAPAIRSFEVSVECASSPSRQPHVVAQEVLPAGAEVELELSLLAGPYRLRCWPPIDTAMLEVDAAAAETGARITATREGFRPTRSKIQPGRRTLAIKNSLDRPLTVTLERSWRPPDLLTAGRLLEEPGARALLPPHALDPEMQVEGRRAAVVALSMASTGEASIQALAEAAARLGAVRVHSSLTGVVATWNTLGEALAALVTLNGQFPLYGAITEGTVLEIALPYGVTTTGAAVDEAQALLRNAMQGLVAYPVRLNNNAEIRAAVARGGITRVSSAYTLPEGSPNALWLSFDG